jgi:hypothetical protein
VFLAAGTCIGLIGDAYYTVRHKVSEKEVAPAMFFKPDVNFNSDGKEIAKDINTTKKNSLTKKNETSKTEPVVEEEIKTTPEKINMPENDDSTK